MPATTAQEPPRGERIYFLDRLAGEVTRQMVIYEPIDAETDPEDLEYRIRCVELSDTEPSSWLTGSREGGAIRIYFPDDQYEGFPPFLDLEMPRKAQIGQQWRLRRGDGVAAATFVLKRIEAGIAPGTWKHGDIVSAIFEGAPYLARIIRKTEQGSVLVHWAVDDQFSEIDPEDILARSEQPWPRAFMPRNLEIED